jgi:hypothetical protein
VKNLALKFGVNPWELNKDFGNCAYFSVFMLQSEKLGTDVWSGPMGIEQGFWKLQVFLFFVAE